MSERILTNKVPEPAFDTDDSTSTKQTDLEFLTSNFRPKYFGAWVDVAKGDTIIEAEEGRQPRELVLNARSSSKKKFIWGGYALICGARVSIQFYDQVLEGSLAGDVIHWANGAQWKRGEDKNKSAGEAVAEAGVAAAAGMGVGGGAAAAGGAAVVQGGVVQQEARMPGAKEEVANIPRALPLELVDSGKKNALGETDASPKQRRWFSYNMEPDGDTAVENLQGSFS